MNEMNERVIVPIKEAILFLWNKYRGLTLIGLNLLFFGFVGPDLFSAASTIANTAGFGLVIGLAALDFGYLHDKGYINKVKEHFFDA